MRACSAISRPSGVGKTTLLRSFNRLLEEDRNFTVKGQVELDGINIYHPNSNVYDVRRKIGIVFQKPTIFPISIYKNVVFGAKHVAKEKSKEQLKGLAEECLKSAFLWDEVKDRLNDKAIDLSIGQQQRLAIARTLAVSPEVILMDEPTASLDENATLEIENLIKDIKKKRSVLLVTHDKPQAERIADHLIELKPGQSGATISSIPKGA